MPEALELLRDGRYQDLWQRCCGFLDLDLHQFMTIQRRLLLEQLSLQGQCELGRRIMRNGVPLSVEEFREVVPLTTYADYAPFLLERRDDVLPEKPKYWQRTSGRSGQYRMKWAPVTERMYREQSALFLAVMMLASCDRKGEVKFEEHDKILYSLAPTPYASGFWSQGLAEESIFDFLPPVEEALKLDFQARFKRGFELALNDGLDIFFGLASILVTIGERFAGQGASGQSRSIPRQPKALFRLVKAMAKAKLAGRPMMPKDLWRLKGLASGGGDAGVFREKVKQMWGRYPLEVYGCTESNLLAVQTWDYQGMSFIPYFSFLEFLPTSEITQLATTPDYQPETRLLDEVEPGGMYELIITNLLGGAFIRYRTGDLIRIISLRNENTGVATPQMTFFSRIDNVIELGGFTSLTESIVWRALEASGVPYRDWTVRKEAIDRPKLRLYLELKEGAPNLNGHITSAVHAALRRFDADYAAIEDMLGYVPLEVSVLPAGAFARFMARQQAAGADLAWLKPPHMNPPQAALEVLLEPLAVR